MSDSSEDSSSHEKGNSLYAALARTATRSVALYFSRPVRLFRPSKVSGWHSLRGLAMQHGATLSPRYLSQLVKDQGIMVIPRHFVPPMLVNAALGTILWASYTEASTHLEPHLGNASVPLSGGFAGGMQAVFAAPAENVRLVLEGGTKEGWSHAWKEVFYGTKLSPNPTVELSKQQRVREIRQVIHWMREFGDMAGRGWNGWGWGFAKDVYGFAAFFSIFEITRHVALRAKVTATAIAQGQPIGELESFRKYIPRSVHGLTLVAGGVFAGLAYEVSCRPWDVARRIVHVESLTDSYPNSSVSLLLMKKFREEGPSYFFRDTTHTSDTIPGPQRRLHTTLRTLARVGPWGVGFLVWEAFGPGLS